MSLLFTVLFLPMPAFAQSARVPVYIAHTGDDGAGKQLAYRLREELNRSSRFSLANGYNSAGFIIRLVTINPNEDTNRSNWTAYSFVITVYNKDGRDFFITSLVGTCGIQKIYQCAANLVADIDSALQDIIKEEQR